MESKDQPRTPDKQDDGSTYLQSAKEANENQKRTTSYGSPAAKRSNDVWEKEGDRTRALEKHESGPSHQLSANEVSKNGWKSQQFCLIQIARESPFKSFIGFKGALS